MYTLKLVALAALDWTFRSLLFFTLLLAAIVMTLRSPEQIKTALNSTDAYTKFVSETIEANKNNQQQNGIPLEDPKVQAIIYQGFPASDLEHKTAAVIDSAYDWLEGRSQNIEFTVDFSDNLAFVADALSSYAVIELASKPQCGAALETINPFTATCYPRDANLAIEKNKIETAALADGALLPKTVITEADLPKNEDGKSIDQVYSFAPALFDLLAVSPIILFGFTILCCVLYVALSRIRRRAIRQLSTTLAISGLLVCVSPIIITYVLPYVFPSFGGGFGGGGLQAVFSEVMNEINKMLNIQLILLGLTTTVIGLMAIILEGVSRPKQNYATVAVKSGLISSHQSRTNKGRFKLDPSKVPMISSEYSVTKSKSKKQKSKKYRKLKKRGF